MRIAIDVMGGDHAPIKILEGAVAARGLLESEDRLILVGNREVIEKYLAEKVTYSYQLNEDKMKMWPKDVETLTSLFTRQK